MRAWLNPTISTSPLFCCYSLWFSTDTYTSQARQLPHSQCLLTEEETRVLLPWLLQLQLPCSPVPTQQAASSQSWDLLLPSPLISLEPGHKWSPPNMLHPSCLGCICARSGPTWWHLQMTDRSLAGPQLDHQHALLSSSHWKPPHHIKRFFPLQCKVLKSRTLYLLTLNHWTTLQPNSSSVKHKTNKLGAWHNHREPRISH